MLDKIKKKNQITIKILFLLIVFLYSSSCNHSRGNYYKVSKGDNLYRISKKYNVDVKDLMRFNGISQPENLKTGRVLYIPTKTAKKTFKHNKRKSSRKYYLPRKESKLILTQKFSWPLKGKLLTTFGSGLKNHYDGINIQSAYGKEVRAASKGQVLYSGSGLKGYGNMIILKHSDKIYSIYALNSENLVSIGDIVQKSQVIAKVGGLPKIGKSFLHFQIRKGKSAIDPLRVLE